MRALKLKMSRGKPRRADCGEDSFHLAHFARRRGDDAQADEMHDRALVSSRTSNLCSFGNLCSFVGVVNFAALRVLFLVWVLFFVCWGSDIARAQVPDAQVLDSEKTTYARAVEFCRGIAKRPMALDLDERVLCFDGAILKEQDISLVNGLVEKGLFVVRSFGGEARIALTLADLLRERHATVIVYDYCLSACASYLLVASAETFIMKDSLVAWHHTTAPLCTSLEVAKDGGPKRLEKLACSDSPPEY